MTTFLDRIFILAQATLNSASRLFKIMGWVVLLSFVFPKDINKVDFRGVARAPVSVAVDAMSPAWGALNDVRESFAIEQNEIEKEIVSKNWGQVTVNAGLDTKRLRELVIEKPSPLTLELQATPIETTVISELAGLKVGQPQAGKIAMAQNFESVLSDFDQVPVYNAYGELTPLRERKQQLLAAMEPIQINVPTVAEKAKALIEQEALVSQQNQIERVIQTQTGQHIYVAKAPQERHQEQQTAKELSVSSPPANHDSAASASLRPADWQDHHRRPLLIRGHLKFSQGLAYTGVDLQITVARVFEGEAIETGKIWLRDARYEIPIKEAQGYLITEVHDRSGLLLAYHEYDLNQLPAPQSNQYTVDGIDITLVPVQQGAIVKVISGYSYENKLIPVEAAEVTLEPFGSALKVDGEGQFVERSLEIGSDILVKVASKNHWPTLTRVTSGAAATVRIFHESMMKALIDIVSTEWDRVENQTKGVVWGIVTEKGRPVDGAVVEITGDVGTLSYLNQIYLPDVAMKQTSKNGMFAAIGAEPGLQAVRVTFRNQVFPAQVVKTEPGHVTFLQINFDELQTLRLRVVDGFNENAPIDASVRALGSEVIIDGVTDAQDLKIQKSPLAFHFLEADAGLDYEMIRVEEPLSEHFIRFPMVQRAWLQNLKTQAKLSDQLGVGAIVGWVNENGFDVILNDGSGHAGHQFIYFDRDGRRVERGPRAVGFVLFHVPMGQHTITILPESRKTVITKIIHVEPEFVSSISIR
jgi:hypothetical protein